MEYTTGHNAAVGEAYLTFLYLQQLSNHLLRGCITLATRIPHLQGDEQTTMLERYHETLSQVELAEQKLALAQQAATKAILADGAEVARQHMTDLLVEIGVVPGLGYDKTRVLLDELVEAVTAILAEVTA